MYLPPHFEQNDTHCLHRLISEYPFATWITLGISGLLVNH